MRDGLIIRLLPAVFAAALFTILGQPACNVNVDGGSDGTTAPAGDDTGDDVADDDLAGDDSTTDDTIDDTADDDVVPGCDDILASCNTECAGDGACEDGCLADWELCASDGAGCCTMDNLCGYAGDDVCQCAAQSWDQTDCCGADMAYCEAGCVGEPDEAGCLFGCGMGFDICVGEACGVQAYDCFLGCPDGDTACADACGQSYADCKIYSEDCDAALTNCTSDCGLPGDPDFANCNGGCELIFDLCSGDQCGIDLDSCSTACAGDPVCQNDCGTAYGQCKYDSGDCVFVENQCRDQCATDPQPAQCNSGCDLVVAGCNGEPCADDTVTCAIACAGDQACLDDCNMGYIACTSIDSTCCRADNACALESNGVCDCIGAFDWDSANCTDASNACLTTVDSCVAGCGTDFMCAQTCWTNYYICEGP